jgi:hypothetical protein
MFGGASRRLGRVTDSYVNVGLGAHLTLTRYNSTNIAAIEAALALIKSLDKGEYFTYINVAKFYKVD